MDSHLFKCILLLCVGKSWGQCPASCNCSLPNTVDCSSSGLTSIPINCPTDTITLKLNNNQISDVGANMFTANLQHIDLSDNSISSIAFGAFSNLKILKTLNLKKNRLSRLDGNTFSGIIGQCSYHWNFEEDVLKRPHGSSGWTEDINDGCLIDLTENQILTVEPYAFNNTRNISITLGKQNQPMAIVWNAFSGYEFGIDLTITDINDLQFSKPYGHSFNDVNGLRSIHIANSTLSLDSNAFQGIRDLNLLWIDNCTFTNLSKTAFYIPNFRLDADCEDYGINGYRYEIRSGRIHIWNSYIPKLPERAFQLTNAGAIVLYRNKIDEIEAGAFRGIFDVCYLSITENEFTTGILSTGSLNGLLSNIMYAEVANNTFTVIESNIFGEKEITSPNHFFIDMRKVSSEVTIKKRAFAGLYRAQTFTLTGANIKFTTNMFEGISYLGNLNLNYLNWMRNKTVLPNNVFKLATVNRIYMHSPGTLEMSLNEDTFQTAESSIHRLQSVTLDFESMPCDCAVVDMKRHFSQYYSGIQDKISCLHKDGYKSYIYGTSTDDLKACPASHAAGWNSTKIIILLSGLQFAFKMFF